MIARRGVAAGLLAGAALLALAGLAGAHNPALTVYAPAQADELLVAAGEEGRLAGLAPDGEVAWEANRTLHATQAPVPSGDAVLVPARTVPGGDPVILGADDDGIAFETTLDATGLAHATADPEGGWTVATRGGQLAHVAPDGTVEAVHEAPIEAVVPPAPAPGGWVLAGGDRDVVVVDDEGTEQASTRVSGRPSDVSVDGGTVLVAFYGEPRGHATLQAFSPELDPRWVADFEEAIRVGGEVAWTPEGPLVGLFAPSGADVVALDGEGEERWREPVNDTAAAVTRAGERVLAVTNDEVRALDAEGGDLRWQASIEPRVDSPRALDGFAVAGGANDTLVALGLEDGQPRWTVTDGVREVPWDEHGLGGGAGDGNRSTDGEPTGEGAEGAPAPAPGAGVVAAIGAASAGLLAGSRVR